MSRAQSESASSVRLFRQMCVSKKESCNRFPVAARPSFCMYPTPKGSRTMFAQFLRNISRKLFRQAVAGNSRQKPIRRQLQVEALENRDVVMVGLAYHL